jgi:hypothetical protein
MTLYLMILSSVSKQQSFLFSETANTLSSSLILTKMLVSKKAKIMLMKLTPGRDSISL